MDFIRSVIFCVHSLGGLEVQLIPEVWLSKSHGRGVVQPPDSFTFLPGEALRATSQERPAGHWALLGTKGRRGVKFCSCWKLSLGILLTMSAQPDPFTTAAAYSLYILFTKFGDSN